MVDINGNETNLPCVTFKDEWGNLCSFQRSSAAGKEGVWLGVEAPIGRRMHLTRAEVAALLPYLQQFVATGSFDSAQL